MRRRPDPGNEQSFDDAPAAVGVDGLAVDPKALRRLAELEGRDEMSEHTPTPWEVATGHPSRGLFVLGPPDEHGYAPQICEVDKTEDMEANAAFIVRAVNSHEALVAALEAVEWGSEDNSCLLCFRKSNEGHMADCEIGTALRAAEPD